MFKEVPLEDMSDQPRGRVPQLVVDSLEPEQKTVLQFLLKSLSEEMAAAVVADDGYVAGAFNYLLIDPAVGLAFSELGTALGEKSQHVDARLRELVILETAHQLGCAYEWNAHAPRATSVGITAAEVIAIAEGTSLPTANDHEELARTLVCALIRDHALPDGLFDAAHRAFGLVMLFDIVMIIGYYLMMSIPLTAFGLPTL